MSEGVSGFGSVRALLSTLFGVGMYFTPSAFAKSGILYGFLQLFGVGFISFLSILVLFLFSLEKTEKKILENKDIEEGMPLRSHSIQVQKEANLSESISTVTKISYSSLGSSINRYLGHVIDGMITITSISTVLFFQKFVSLISFSLLGNDVEKTTNFNLYYVFVALYGLLIWGGGQFKNLQSIDWLSQISFTCIVLNCLIVGILNFFLKDFTATHVFNPDKHISLSVISAFVFAMFCQTNVVAIFTEMKNKSTKSLILTAAFAVLGACGFYGAMGISGSLLFGDNMPNKDIITIFANGNSDIVKHLFDTQSLFRYVHYIIPSLAIVGLLISSVYQLAAVTRSLNEKSFFKNMSLTKRQAFSTAIVMCSVSIVNMFPQISLGLVFDIIGQFMCNPLAYAFPFLFPFIQSIKERNFRLRFFGSMLLIILSIVFGIGGFTYGLLKADLPIEVNSVFNSTEKANATIFD